MTKKGRPSTKSHLCGNNIFCTEPCNTDKWGNYKAYCSDGCRDIATPLKFADTYSKKDIDAITEKRVKTVKAKHGVDNVSQTTEVREKLKKTTKATKDIRLKKTKETNLLNHGVESTNSLPEVQKKKTTTMKERTGYEYPLQVPKIAEIVSVKNTANAPDRVSAGRKTKLKVHGDENYNNREKYVETCTERFGSANPSQNATVHAKKMKSTYRTREFTFPSGKVVRLKGYEPKAVEELLKTYHESEIITETELIPVIPYFENDGSSHVYFPDIYIPKDNLLVEVKSQYTYNGFIGWYNTNKLKEAASISEGYNFKFMIMSKK